MDRGCEFKFGAPYCQARPYKDIEISIEGFRNAAYVGTVIRSTIFNLYPLDVNFARFSTQQHSHRWPCRSNLLHVLNQAYQHR